MRFQRKLERKTSLNPYYPAVYASKAALRYDRKNCKRPETKYKTVRVYNYTGDRKRIFKTHANKAVRKCDAVISYGHYKKAFDLAWTID